MSTIGANYEIHARIRARGMHKELKEEVAVVLYIALAIELVEDSLTADVALGSSLKILLLGSSIEGGYASVLLFYLEEVNTTCSGRQPNSAAARSRQRYTVRDAARDALCPPRPGLAHRAIAPSTA